ncbi:MAG TPA: L-aspartate oxidase [Planctomycetota bacterium]|nr:L-aspartate oxidase [Planctomycetota bacterium]
MKKHLEKRRYLASFDSRALPHIFTDVLVIGGGVAGLRAAIAASEYGNVTVVVKGAVEESNTAQAQGGIAVALSEGDSVSRHAEDTVATGVGLCDEETVRVVVGEGPERVTELIDWGAKFDRTDAGYEFTKEGGHSTARILRARGDATGAEITRVLVDVARARSSIGLLEDHFVIDLLPSEGEATGALVFNPRRGHVLIWASKVILATGGIGRVYRETTNPAGATGDGLAIAYRAGVVLQDLEFVQFHPTTLYIAGASRALISETVRGEGARLLNRHGERFMPKYHDAAELAPRDVVSRSIVTEIQRTGHPCVYLDVTHLGKDHLRHRFPAIYRECLSFDIDISKDRIPVRPSAHYFIGGVKVDTLGRTCVPDLFAVGEVSCTGLHGANRLGSNSLLEGLVCGARAGRRAGEQLGEAGRNSRPRPVACKLTQPKRGEIDLGDVENSLRSLMWRAAGIEREEAHLETAEDYVDFWCGYVMDKTFVDVHGWTIQNMLTTAKLVLHAARRRRESRGVHFRTDFPDTDDVKWKRHITVQRGS